MAGDYDEASGDLRSGFQRGKTANSFRKNTAVGSDNWPLHEYAKIDPADLDKAGIQAAEWKSQCVVPMQYLMNVMSMIPKKKKGDYRMIAAMASGWRMDTKLDKHGERAWNSAVADVDDSAKPGKCCLHVMEDRQIFIDILRSLESDTLQGLLDFVNFYDAIDPAVPREELIIQGYGLTKTAFTMLGHFAPMLLKLGKVYKGPTSSRGRGIVVGCGRSDSMARGLTVRTLGRLRTFCEKLLGVNDTLLAEGKAGVKTEIFVDDGTMILWAKSELNQADGTPGLNRMAYDVAQEWTHMVVNLLKLQTSDKNIFVPDGPPCPGSRARLPIQRVHRCHRLPHRGRQQECIQTSHQSHIQRS